MKLLVRFSAPPNAETVFLCGSWDNYQPYPLVKHKESPGNGGWYNSWSVGLQHGQRYWYYYLIDGRHWHDPRVPVDPETFGTEPEIRRVNILDIPQQPDSGQDESFRERRLYQVDETAEETAFNPSLS